MYTFCRITVNKMYLSYLPDWQGVKTLLFHL